MAKRFKKGDTAYVPVKIGDVEYEDRWYDYAVRISSDDGERTGSSFCVRDEEVKSAEEVAEANGLYTSHCDEGYDAHVDLVTARAACWRKMGKGQEQGRK